MGIARSGRNTGVLAAVLALALTYATGPAAAKGGEAGGSGNEFFLNDAWSASANIHFFYGAGSDQIYVGDWNDDGVDSLVARRGNAYHVRNGLSSGAADLSISYGRADDTVLAGDWDGDGADSLAVRRGRTYYFKNSLSSGPADYTQDYGRGDDVVLVGDWNGDGVDTLAVRRGNTYYFKNSLASGPADYTQAYGRATDAVLVGDWDGDEEDTLAVRRGNVYYIKDSFAGGPADTVVAYGRATDAVFAGDWNADGKDTLGVRRVPGVVGTGTLQVGVSVAPATYRSTGSADFCYWERLSSFPGEEDEAVIVAGYGLHQIVTVAPSDAGFHSDPECASWLPLEATFPVVRPTTFGDGMYHVGGHLAPGTYTASEPQFCYWERLSGFTGAVTDVIQSGEGVATVTVAASDVGFLSIDCGTWSPA